MLLTHLQTDTRTQPFIVKDKKNVFSKGLCYKICNLGGENHFSIGDLINNE